MLWISLLLLSGTSTYIIPNAIRIQYLDEHGFSLSKITQEKNYLTPVSVPENV